MARHRLRRHRLTLVPVINTARCIQPGPGTVAAVQSIPTQIQSRLRALVQCIDLSTTEPIVDGVVWRWIRSRREYGG